MNFIDRFRTPAALRALTSPFTLAVFGGVGVMLILGGLPLPVAIAGGLVAATARVASAGGRSSSAKRPERIDPFAVGEPWRVFVREALQVRARFADLVHDTPAGPFRERLDEIGRGIDLAVKDCWSISRQADDLSGVRRQIDTQAISRRLASLEGVSGPTDTTEGLRASLEAQLSSARRVDSAIDGARGRLEVLDARLAESVTRAAELTTLGDQPGLTGVAADIDDVVDEMEALRQALEEIDRAEGPGER
ncbi:MAG: hypothetical protein GY745_23440 [Actinomycetia bacterium]|nr:hypothetical protein [Actinomycetes bacterium]